MDRQHDGRQPKADMQQLDDALNMLADSLMPTPGGWEGGWVGNGGAWLLLFAGWAALPRELVVQLLLPPNQTTAAAWPGLHPAQPPCPPCAPCSVALPAEERATMMGAFESVRALLLARWPGARVHLFGSVANGLSVRHNNDLDVCLELAEVQQDDLVRGVGWVGGVGGRARWVGGWVAGHSWAAQCMWRAG